MLSLVLPKGSLERATLELFEAADLTVRRGSDRDYRASIDDPRIDKVMFLRPQEIPQYVEQGLFDVGITGRDWITETDSDVVAVKAGPDGSLELPGTFPMRDLVDVGVELRDAPAGPYSTIAGLVLLLLGRIPEEPGDVVEVSGWKIEVRQVEHHAITLVRLRSQAKPRNEVDV